MSGDISKALNLNTQTRVEAALEIGVEMTGAALSGFTYGAVGSPTVQGVPADLAIGGVLLLTKNDALRTLGRGIATGSIARMSHDLGSRVHAARSLKS